MAIVQKEDIYRIWIQKNEHLLPKNVSDAIKELIELEDVMNKRAMLPHETALLDELLGIIIEENVRNAFIQGLETGLNLKK